MTIVFILIIKKTLGLRASEQEEIIGLDVTEHGLISSYADFAPALTDIGMKGYTKDDAKSVKRRSALPEHLLFLLTRQLRLRTTQFLHLTADLR